LNLKKNGIITPFKIIANNLSEANMYIQSVSLDGRRLKRPFISYSQIMNGNNLVFEMGKQPNFKAFEKH
ncbi:MAG: glycoside hydrolase family 92 protein, partial [Flavobacteriaceae bacterium]|nr:glycoside hydrolase family 92 protein [Flavobacteriaceae bacterium]